MSRMSWFKLLVYAAIPFLSGIGGGVALSMNWVDWTRLLCASSVASLMAVRGFLDKSVSHDEQKQEEEKAP